MGLSDRQDNVVDLAASTTWGGVASRRRQRESVPPSRSPGSRTMGSSSSSPPPTPRRTLACGERLGAAPRPAVFHSRDRWRSGRPPRHARVRATGATTPQRLAAGPARFLSNAVGLRSARGAGRARLTVPRSVVRSRRTLPGSIFAAPSLPQVFSRNRFNSSASAADRGRSGKVRVPSAKPRSLDAATSTRTPTLTRFRFRFRTSDSAAHASWTNFLAAATCAAVPDAHVAPVAGRAHDDLRASASAAAARRRRGAGPTAADALGLALARRRDTSSARVERRLRRPRRPARSARY